MRGKLSAAVAVVALISFGAGAAAPSGGKPEFGAFGLDPNGPDPTVAAGDDFYRHVDGHWLATTPIPPDRSWYGEPVRLREQAQARVRDILEAAAQAPAGPDARKFGDYYASFMDEAAIAKAGLAPLKPQLDMIAQVKTLDDLARAFAAIDRVEPVPLGATESSFPVNIGVDADLRDPTRHSVSLDQGGLGLPDRDYYFGADPKLVAARTAYKSYIVSLFTLAGMADPAPRADAIIALETRIAQAHWARADHRDYDKIYNPMTPAALAKAAPGFPWASYLAAAKVGGEATIVVNTPSALTGFAKLAGSVPIAVWRDYLALRLIGNAAPVLPQAYVDADFAFHGKALSGTPQLRVRWKRAADAAGLAMGDAIGRVYAERWFPASSKTAMERLVGEVKVAMAGRIDRLAWMAPATKARAKVKLANLRVEVGYPDHWRDYSGLTIVRGDALGNLQRANAFEYDREIAKLGRPVDRSEWGIYATPQTVNAFNAGQLNKLIFPAAYLAPPEFDPNADPAVNYGGIGATIGHEISHSFDDQGAKLDEQGRLANWWTPADLAAFKRYTEALAKEFDAYEPLPGLHVNGHLVLGESVADLAGLVAALDAYHASLHGQPAPVLGGLTGDQRFFAAYAQSWRTLWRPEMLRVLVTTDPHPPSEYRADTVRNLDAWYEAYAAKPGQKLYLAPNDRVKIW
ncbi:MAG: M13 family metallopeptidase [Sphingomonadaceae bacterium]|nr:M13 family metallopeptidase [Sphingomonadaceae bacterium]